MGNLFDWMIENPVIMLEIIVGIESLLLFIGIVIWIDRKPAKVVELQLDPPEDAFYVSLADEAETPEKQRIKDIKNQIVLYHVWKYNEGICRLSDAKQIIQEKWNATYTDKWPQYKLWRIGANHVQNALRDAAFANAGDVFAIDGQPLVIIDKPSTKKRAGDTRIMIPLAKLVKHYEMHLKDEHKNSVAQAKDAQEAALRPELIAS